MSYFKINIKIVLFLGFLMASTPIEYTLGISTGYDNNVMRFSEKEFEEAAQSPDIIGRATTFDSYILKLGLKAKKTIYKLRKKEVLIQSNFSFSDYRNNDNKRYWSGGADISFKWGSYKNIKYSLRHLNSYYLRHYINKDIGNSVYSPCFFSDRNQSVALSYKFKKRTWSVLTIGYLQRYYDKPFIEFDLDILYLRAKQNFRIKNLGSIGIQFESGRAISNSNEIPLRPSSFDRSYRSSELYIPIVISKNVLFLDEVGTSYRSEVREYDAEDFNDPLHSGRSHKDSKYDFWIKKKISNDLAVKFMSRYRNRQTTSSYDWVSNLKSFNQLQTWLSIEWDIDYDRY